MEPQKYHLHLLSLSTPPSLFLMEIVHVNSMPPTEGETINSQQKGASRLLCAAMCCMWLLCEVTYHSFPVLTLPSLFSASSLHHSFLSHPYPSISSFISFLSTCYDLSLTSREKKLYQRLHNFDSFSSCI